MEQEASDASSIQCASSTTISVGIISTRSRNVSTVLKSRSRLGSSASSASVSGVVGTSASNGIARSGSHGARSGITPVTNGVSCAPGLLRVSVVDARELPQQVRARRSTGSDDPVLLAARVELSEADRERPQLVDEARLADPRLADELDDLDWRMRAASTAWPSAASSRSRPMSGSSSSLVLRRATPVDCADVVRRDGPLLALDEERLSLGLVERARERSSTSPVARISPGSARAVSRAARLTVSPMTA